MRNILNVFSPSRYAPEVVKVNRDLWIKKAEDAFDVVTELSVVLEEFVSPVDAQEMFKSNDFLMDELAKFVSSINITVLSDVPQLPIVTNSNVSEIKPKLDIVQNENENKRMNVSRANQVQEEDHDEQSQCSESEPRGSISDPTKNLLLLQECSREAAIEVQEELRQSLGEREVPLEHLKDVLLVLQDLFKLASVDQRFHRHVFDYVMLRSTLIKFPIQEMHVMLQMSSGSIQRSLSCITIDYIQLPLSRCLVTAMNIK